MMFAISMPLRACNDYIIGNILVSHLRVTWILCIQDLARKKMKSKLYIFKINSINEPYKFQNVKSKKKKWEKINLSIFIKNLFISSKPKNYFWKTVIVASSFIIIKIIFLLGAIPYIEICT